MNYQIKEHYDSSGKKISRLGVRKVMFNHEIRKFEVDGVEGWKLFPYKIKNREKFYFRDHPKQINPKSQTFRNYWTEGVDCFAKKCVEGIGVNDEGTWVFMFNKLFKYTNYMVIVDKNRSEIHPDLSTVEWAGATYVACCDGFSDFSGDKEFSCNHYLKRLWDGEEISEVEMELIPDHIYKDKDKKIFKTYVDPWEYLTRFYLIDNPRGDLGEPIYSNPRSNGIWLGGRGISKSFIIFLLDFFWEWTWGGITPTADNGYRYLYEEKHKAKNRLLFAAGSAVSDPLDRSLANIKAFYDRQPGKFEYPQSPNPRNRRPDYMGPFYKNKTGTWASGNKIQHVVKHKTGVSDIEGSMCQTSILTRDNKKVAAGDRFRRIYVEEAGFVDYLLDIHAVNKDSVAVEGDPVGSMFYLGTGGEMESITAAKTMFENPKGYNIFGVTDYFKNKNRKTGYFIPSYMKFRKWNDKQGNTRYEFGLQKILEVRQTNAKEMDSVSFDTEIMFNPIVPTEMLRPSRRSILPVREAQERLSDMEAYGLFDFKANIGRFDFDPNEKYGVGFKKDMAKTLRPIIKYNVDENKIDKRGAPIIYEQPPDYIPEGLYWVVYDPAAKSGDGSSFHSVIVYKHFYTGTEKTLEDAIVAEWIGREETLDLNYEKVIRIAKYFNAKIFPEINVAGFVEWCNRMNYYDMLQPSSVNLEKELNPKYKAGYYKVGFQMNERKKTWSLQRLHDWLMEIKARDEITNVPTMRNIDYIFSPRILDEIVNYTEKGNYDHISSLLGLMILLGQLDSQQPVSMEEKKKSKIYDFMIKQTTRKRKRSSFENF